jgi:hypothetical protein
MLRYIRVFLFMLLFKTLGMGQIVRSMQAGDKSPSQTSLDELLDRISGLPAEYKADLGFAIIDAGPRSLSPKRKRALLDDISHSAASAHYPYMVVEAAGHAHSDTLSHVTRNMLAMLKLDTLDIQTRAIERALPSSPQFASHLFEELNLGEVRAFCKDAMVEDVSVFYVTAAKIIEDKRIKTVFKHDKVLYLQSLASNLRVPAQIAPLANLMIQVPLSPEQLGQVEMAFVSSLSTITASDREMTAAEEGEDLSHVIGSLSAKLTQSGISSQPLLAAYRGFLLRGLTPERCADHSLDRTEMAQHFDALLPDKPPDSSDMSPLSRSQLNPESTGDAASYQIVPFNEQMMAKMQRIMAAHQARVTGEYRSGQPGTIEPEPSDVEDVVKYAISLEPSGAECPVCDFHAKGHILMMLIDILPAGQELERAISAEVDYMSLNVMQNDDPIAWLALFKHLLNDGRKPQEEATAALAAEAKKGMLPWGLPNPEAGVIRKSLRSSSDPIIVAYMSADDLLHLPYLTIMQQAHAK